MSLPRRIALLLALITVGLYLPVAWFGFCVYDDSLYVTENPTVQQGVTLAGLKWAFTTLAAANWHPLTWISHMIDCGLFGLNPAGPHLVNVLIHAANVVLLFTLLRRLLEAGRWGEAPDEPGPGGSFALAGSSRGRSPHQKIWPATFIAALFAWHPMHVESVAWIAERKDVLSTFFALLALLAYAHYVNARNEQNPRAKVYYAGSLLAFALGLLAKPMLVTLPCVLLLLDYWPLRRVTDDKRRVAEALRLVVEKIPFFIITAASCVITIIAQSRPGSNAVVPLATAPLFYRLKNLPVAYVEYLQKTFWPTDLAIFYPLPHKIPVAEAGVAAGVLVAITLITLWRHRQRAYLLMGWLWFLGMLVPVIGLVQVGGAQIADRYSYLPSVGIFIAVTFAALDLAVRWRIPRSVLTGAALAILLATVVAMENQLRHWQNNVTLFEHALAVTADNDVARNNFGIALEQQNRLAEAVEQYRIAIQLSPGRYHGHHNLASALDRLGRPAEALAAHRQAARLEPSMSFLHTWLGMSLAGADQAEEALKEFATAIQLDPQDPWPRLERAKLLLRQGRDPEALTELRAALRSLPDNVDLLTYTAQVLAASENAATRDGQNAFVLAAKANLLTSGTRVWTLDVLGMACAEMGKFDEAQMAAQQALAVAAAIKLKGLTPIQQRLKLYQNHQPWRESFRTTNAPMAK